MKVVFLVLSFIVVLILVRLFALKLQQCIRQNEFEKRMKEIREEKNKRQSEQEKFNDFNKNIDEVRIVLKGSLMNEKQNLDSKYIGNVYRAKNGRFGSKKQLGDV